MTRALIIVAVGCALACGGSCPVFQSAAFDVRIVDTNGNHLCAATVTASGAENFALQTFDAKACAFHEANMAPPGTYMVTATAPGYSTASMGVVVTKGDCGQDSSPTVTLTLVPYGS